MRWSSLAGRIYRLEKRHFAGDADELRAILRKRGMAKMIRKLKSGEYRLYSRKKNAKTGKRRNLGTFSSVEKAKAHERAVQYFKRH
jgi:hypothetical protein